MPVAYAAQGNVLNSYSQTDPLATAARVAIGMAVIFSYPLGFTALRDGVASLLKLRRAGLASIPSALPWHTHAPLSLGLLGAVTTLGCVVTELGLVNALRGSIFGALLMFAIPGALVLSPRVPGPWSRAERALAWGTLSWAVLLGVGGSSVTCLNQFGLLSGQNQTT